MNDILRLINEFNAAQCGGSIIINGDSGVNEEAAYNDQGTWVIVPKYQDILAATPVPSALTPAAKA